RQTQKNLAQVEIKNLKGDTWTFEKLTSPVKLTKGNTYTVAEWGTGYFYTSTTASPWTGDSNIKVSGTDYVNSGTKDTYPTSYLAGYIYGIADIGYTVGLGTGGAPFKGDNLALDATASHGGGGSGVWGPDRLNNGDKIGTYNDCWTSYSSPNNWVQLDWNKKVTVGSMIIYYTRWRTSIGPNYCLHQFDVQWWDGSKWQTDQSIDDKSYGTNNDHYVVMKTPRTTTRVRIANMISVGTYNIMIQEWEVFGGGGAGSPGWGAYGAGCFNVNMTLNMSIPDDHPSSGTPWDDMNITVMLRDDDDHKLIPETGLGPVEQPVSVYTNSYYYYSGYNGRKVVLDDKLNLYVIYL
ncbi:MAG: hypothetical protein KAJ51_02970, partial [Thermoplasmata archaeon]|nr:hypothetical protein [Thermoplasmata archaeon]